MDSKTNEILQKFSKQNQQEVKLSVMDDAKEAIRNATDICKDLETEARQIDDKLYKVLQMLDEMLPEVRFAEELIKDAKSIKKNTEKAQTQFKKAADNLGVDIKSSKEYKQLEEKSAEIDKWISFAQDIVKDSKKYIK